MIHAHKFRAKQAHTTGAPAEKPPCSPYYVPILGHTSIGHMTKNREVFFIIITHLFQLLCCCNEEKNQTNENSWQSCLDSFKKPSNPTAQGLLFVFFEPASESVGSRVAAWSAASFSGRMTWLVSHECGGLRWIHSFIHSVAAVLICFMSSKSPAAERLGEVSLLVFIDVYDHTTAISTLDWDSHCCRSR